MAVSFVRIDDRMIHGQTVTRWALEYPCDGIIAVNDAAASNPVLKSAYKSAAPDKKTFVWTMEHFKEKAQTVRDSKTRYFLITKNPVDMAEILVNLSSWGRATTVPAPPRSATTSRSPRRRPRRSRPSPRRATPSTSA